MTSRIPVAKIAFAAALPLALTAAPALAQVQQGNPNAANQSLSNMGAARATQQGVTTQNNTTMMNVQRSQNAPPAPAMPTPIPHAGAPGR